MNSVLLTNMYAGIGGGEIALLEHALFLKQKKIKVFVVLLEHGEFEKRLKDHGIDKVIVLPFGWKGGKAKSAISMIIIARKIFQVIRKNQIELVISYTLNDLVFAGFASKMTGVPLVYRSQADVIGVDKDINKTWMGSYFLRIFKYLSPYVIATTKGEENRLLRLGYDKNKLSTVYLGVNSSQFMPDQETVRSLKQSLGVKDDEYVISIFGRLTEWKGQLEFVRALGEVSKLGYPVKGWIVGDASFGGGVKYKNTLQKAVHDSGMDGQIALLGMRNDVAELMSASDIVVHASYKEPFGLVIVEAMMMGTVVIASDVSGPRESVENGVTGMLVAPKDVNGIVNSITTLLDDESLRSEMATAGRRRSKKMFDRNKNLAELTVLCEKIIEVENR